MWADLIFHKDLGVSFSTYIYLDTSFSRSMLSDTIKRKALWCDRIVLIDILVCLSSSLQCHFFTRLLLITRFSYLRLASLVLTT